VLKRAFDARVIPLVAYTDPEVAWAGVTEGEAKAKGSKVGKGVFPWAASDRSLSLGRDKGMTKVLFDEQTDRVIGAGIVGPNASDLIAEAVVAIEMGYDATDIGHTITPLRPSRKASTSPPRCSREPLPTSCLPRERAGSCTRRFY
jgi:dihydrolipoamide dehydrogenase